MAGEPAFRETLLDAARGAVERARRCPRLVAAALANHRGMASSIGEVDHERIDVLRLALAAVGDDDSAGVGPPAREPRHRAVLQRRAGERPAPRRRGRGDGPTPRRRRALLHVLNVTFLARCLPDAYDHIQATSAEAMALAERIDDPVAGAWAAINRVYALAMALDGDGIDAALAAASRRRRRGRPALPAAGTSATSPPRTCSGRATSSGPSCSPPRRSSWASESGQPEAFAVLRSGPGQHPPPPGPPRRDPRPRPRDRTATAPGCVALQGVLAMILSECGADDEARVLLDAAHAQRLQPGLVRLRVAHRDHGLGRRRGPPGRRGRRRGALRPAVPVHAASASRPGRATTASSSAYLGRLAVLLGRDDEALAHFEAERRGAAGRAAPLWSASNQIEWAPPGRAVTPTAEPRRSRS